MSITAIAQPSRTMGHEKRKSSPGFFSVLLGRGSTSLATAATSASTAPPEKRSAEQTPTSQRAHSASEQGKAYAQGRRVSYSAEPPATARASMSRDRVRKEVKRDVATTRPHSTAAFEAAVQSQALPTIGRSKSVSRPAPSSMRSPHKEIFVDAKEVPEGHETSISKVRHSRKVSFNTPTSSLRKGRVAHTQLEEAGSSQDSFFSPRAPRPIPKATKPKYTRSAPKAEADDRNWNSSTATLHNKEEPRSLSSKPRRSKGSSYPLAMDAQGESFHAVRVSGPDRVIIAPVSPQTEEEIGAQLNRLSTSSGPGSRRPGPAPLAPYATASRRTSQDVSRSKSRPSELQRSRSQRERRSATAEGDAVAARESARSRSRPDKVASRATMLPPALPDLAGATVLSQTMARARSGDRTRTSYHGSNALQHDFGTTPMFNERHPNARMKAQRA